jgi:hypothetical protein
MSYRRVIPRDLFNEAKLLKCLGRLALHVLDNVNMSKNFLECSLDDEENMGFVVVQNPSDGSIDCSNFSCITRWGQRVRLYTLLNAKDNYPLWFEGEKNNRLVNDLVFDEQGNFTKEFKFFFTDLRGDD